MGVKKILKIGSSVLLGAVLLFSIPLNSVKAADSYELNNPVKVYYDSFKAKAKKNHTSTYDAGTYYIYRIYNGMINITKDPGVAGGWINPEDNINGLPFEFDEFKKKVGTFNEDKSLFEVKVKTFGYMSASKAKHEKDRVNIVHPGVYYIFASHNGMINISSEKDVAGSWINPNSNERVKPSIPIIEFKGSASTKKAN